MTRLILAISPDFNLLEQISAHLQEGGRFQVFTAASGREALAMAATQPFDLAILDAEISDIPFIPLTRELVALHPSLKLLIYPPQNNPRHPVLNGLVANGFLNKPFFGPEVNEKIVQALNDKNLLIEPANSESDLARLWTEHPESGERQIEQLLASTSAIAGILLLQGRVIAGLGALADETSQNVVNFLSRFWTNIQSGELFRYLKMDNETKTYLVYATPLFKDVAFALVYHTNTSLTDIRAEVSRIRKAFIHRYSNTGELRLDFAPKAVMNEPAIYPSPVDTPPPLETPQDQLNWFSPEVQPEPSQETPIDESSEGELADMDISPLGDDEYIPPEDLTEMLSDLEVEEEQPGLTEKELENLDALLAEMPTPDPDVEISSELDNITAQPAELFPTPDLDITPPPLPVAAETLPPPLPVYAETPPPISIVTHPLPEIGEPRKASPITAPLQPVKEVPQSPQSSEFPDFNFKLPWEEGLQNDDNENPVFAPSQEVPPSLPTDQVELPIPVIDDPSSIFFEYHFLLLPVNPQQFITHDLANLLNRQLPKLHESSGWQCSSLSIRPLYIEWTALLPANTCIHEMIQEIKERSEIQIFSGFPVLLQTHLNGEFWAPGYFALSGSRSFSNRLVSDYISLSRQYHPPLAQI